MLDVGLGGWLLLAAAATVVGLSKAALPGAAILSVAIFASVLPARTSTGALLVLLIVGDVFALLAYRRHAHWPTLLRLVPPVLAGLALGFLLLLYGTDDLVRRIIGVILLALVALTLVRRRLMPDGPSGAGPFTTIGYGTLGGFTTMVANAGGPPMSLYLIAARTPVQVFLGTSAWFFAGVNIVKLPFLVGIGLIDLPVLLLDLTLVGFVIGGALLGLLIARRISQVLFERIVLVLTVLGAVYLLF